MCQFASFLHRPDNGDIVVYNLCSHSETQNHLKLKEPLWCEGHYLRDGTISCRVPPLSRPTEQECVERLRRKYPTFYDFLNWALMQNLGGWLNLRGCDLSKLKTWPKTIGGWLDLSGCDLSKLKTWPETIGGSLYLRGCDLSKVKVPPDYRIVK